MLCDSVVVRTRPRAIPLAMITIRKILHGFPILSHDAYGAPLGSTMISFYCSEMISYHFTGIIFSHGFITLISTHNM